MVTAANRGKYAEGKVKAELKKLEAANCTHHRFPDLHSGSRAPAPADFLILQSGRLRLLEIKQVEQNQQLLKQELLKPQEDILVVVNLNSKSLTLEI